VAAAFACHAMPWPARRRRRQRRRRRPSVCLPLPALRLPVMADSASACHRRPSPPPQAAAASACHALAGTPHAAATQAAPAQCLLAQCLPAVAGPAFACHGQPSVCLPSPAQPTAASGGSVCLPCHGRPAAGGGNICLPSSAQCHSCNRRPRVMQVIQLSHDGHCRMRGSLLASFRDSSTSESPSTCSTTSLPVDFESLGKSA
jgi:hypothetical protein